jgi:hypothetical protein
MKLAFAMIRGTVDIAFFGLSEEDEIFITIAMDEAMHAIKNQMFEINKGSWYILLYRSANIHQ